MSTIRLRVELDSVYLNVDKADYKDAWQEHQEENGAVEEGEDAGEPSDEFVIEQVQEDFEDGTRDLSEAFESAGVSVSRVR